MVKWDREKKTPYVALSMERKGARPRRAVAVVPGAVRKCSCHDETVLHVSVLAVRGWVPAKRDVFTRLEYLGFSFL